MDTTKQDHIVMKDGRVMRMRNGESTPLDEEMTIPDGTTVMPDGTVINPNGSTRMQQEGETILLQGAPANPENMSDRQFKETMEDEELRDEIE